MGFYISNGDGDSTQSPTRETMRAVLEGLDPEDEEHGAAWVADEDGNSMEYEVSGNLAYSRADQTRHLPHVSVERVLELWQLLASGHLDELEREPWLPGARPALSPEEETARERTLAEELRAQDRDFHDRLGAEDPIEACRAPGCDRGSVRLSLFCRRHHFENVKGRPCPFE